MPPARSRVIDDARSEASLTTAKERAVSGPTATKSKKTAVSNLNNAVNTSKAAAAINNAAAATSNTTAPADSTQELPHIDWPAFPTHALHSYRSAYRLQIPSSYTKPHAEMMYKTCDLALRAPSQVLARRKARDLKLYRAQQQASSRLVTNGISKHSKGGRAKDSKQQVSKSKENPDGEPIAQQSMDGPPSPNSHPSQQDSASKRGSDTGSRKSPTISDQQQQEADQEEDTPERIPPTLLQSDPEATVFGTGSSTSLQNSIRKHFNAQHLNEAETIARFTYVVRQQGSTMSSRSLPMSQRLGQLPLPCTVAENIAAVAEAANAHPAAASALASITNAAGGQTTASTAGDSQKGKPPNAHASHSLSTSRALGGQHVEVEGGFGDGRGWIMSTTSCGRAVRVVDSGGHGAFRLRFRP